ncbi:MAG TPA: hypothetical protein PLE72_12300 [Azospira sp.]|uniref:hypothetical protein n=1 Tax=Zoogloea sp. TaxID=49181 RepID=UPI002BE7B34F|nr:hypothetical protein [Zoogloea sp.]HNH18235.1 hypothetical protein [Zoogloea sp.]HNJ77544.1 hypothetical protein [Azospira sp.]
MKLGELDPHLWAKRPKSQTALNLLMAGAKEGDARLADILAGHLRDGVCDEKGKLLFRWAEGAWVSMDDDIDRYRHAA